MRAKGFSYIALNAMCLESYVAVALRTRWIRLLVTYNTSMVGLQCVHRATST